MPLKILVQVFFFEEHLGPDTLHSCCIIQWIIFLGLHLHDVIKNPKGGCEVLSSHMHLCVARYLIYVTLGLFFYFICNDFKDLIHLGLSLMHISIYASIAL